MIWAVILSSLGAVFLGFIFFCIFCFSAVISGHSQPEYRCHNEVLETRGAFWGQGFLSFAPVNGQNVCRS